MMQKFFLSFVILMFLGNGSTLAQNYQSLKLDQAAKQLNKQCYMLTPDQIWEVGGIWGTNKVDVSEDFKINFSVNFGTKSDPEGADGVALIFALEDEIKDTISGQFLGVKGISPSIHLEMDMFKNVDGPLDFNDPDESHLAFFKNGNGKHLDPNCLSKTPSNDGWIFILPRAMCKMDLGTI